MQRTLTLLLVLTSSHLISQSINWVTPCAKQTYCLNPGSCTESAVFLVEKAVTGCGNSNLNYSYKIDLHNNTSIDIQSSQDTIDLNLPKGTHEIQWRANDNCGNVSTACRYLVTIKDCNPPNLICINGLTQNLELPECDAKFNLHSFILQAGDNCTPYQDLDFGMRLITDTTSSFPTDTSMTFGLCEQGLHVVRISVRDENGLTNNCNSYVLVQNNSGFCPCNIDASLGLQGCARTSDSTLLTNYTILAELKGVPLMGQPFTQPVQKTYQDSCFSINFPDLPLNGAYSGTIRGQRTGDPLIGVSTFDLVTINKHILGQQSFTSFFQVLASDANQSKTISTFDIIEIRKLILGVYDTFPNAPSWRFILPMPDTNLTAFAAVRDTYAFNVPNLMADTLLKGFDFIGVKIGDANQNASLQSPDIEDRGAALQFFADEQRLEAGDLRWIPVYATENTRLDGWQLALQANPELLEILDLRGIPPQYVSLKENCELRMSCVYDTPMPLENETALFEMLVRAVQSTDLSAALQPNKGRLAAEAYPSEAAAATRRPLQFSVGKRQQAGTVFFPPRPNPFSEQTVFEVTLDVPQEVTLELFSLNGARVYQATAVLGAGSHRLNISATDLPGSGVWTYRMVAGDLVQTGRLVRFEF